MRRALIATVALVTAGCERSTPITDETRAREAFVRRLAEQEHMTDAWSLANRSDLQFEDGFAPIELVDPLPRTPSWKQLPRADASGLAQAVRWMGARGHLRVRGDGAHRLELHGWTDRTQLYTRPVIEVRFEGIELPRPVVAEDGTFVVAATIPGDQLGDWRDVYIALSTVHEPWRDPAGRLTAKLAVARLEYVVWEPAP